MNELEWKFWLIYMLIYMFVIDSPVERLCTEVNSAQPIVTFDFKRTDALNWHPKTQKFDKNRKFEGWGALEELMFNWFLPPNEEGKPPVRIPASRSASIFLRGMR